MPKQAFAGKECVRQLRKGFYDRSRVQYMGEPVADAGIDSTRAGAAAGVSA